MPDALGLRRSRRLANESPLPSGDLPPTRRLRGTKRNILPQPTSPKDSLPASHKNYITTGSKPFARSLHRNVHIFDNQAPPIEIGGLYVARGVSNELFYDMVAILVESKDYWHLRDEHDK